MRKSFRKYSSLLLIFLLTLILVFGSISAFADENDEENNAGGNGGNESLAYDEQTPDEELLPLGNIKPQIRIKDGRTTAFSSLSGLDKMQGDLVEPFTAEDWKNIKFRITDADGNILCDATAGEMQYGNTDRIEKKLGKFREGDVITLEVLLDTLPPGYHLFHDSAYSYGGFEPKTNEGYYKPANKFSFKLKRNGNVLVPESDNQFLRDTWIYFAVYDIHFDPKDGIIDGKSDIVTNRIGNDNTLDIPVPEKEGYKFSYWRADLTSGKYTWLQPNKSGQDKRYSIIHFWFIDADPNRMDSCEATFYPVWKKVHEVNFDTAGGSEIKNQKVEDGEKAVRPDNPTKKYSEFVDWIYEGKPFDFDTKIEDNMTLTAKWNEYTIPEAEDLTVNEGDEVKAEDFISNLEDMPENTEFKFKNRVDTSKPGTNEVLVEVIYTNGDIKEVTANITVIAEKTGEDSEGSDNNEPPKAGNQSKTGNDNPPPKTGDDTNLALYLVLIGISGVVALTLNVRMIRKRS
jgi:Rib/alpha/Esp surface antigen-like repeat protein